MKIERKDINKIRPYEKNPRKNDQAVDSLVNSIKAFGFQVPIIIDNNGLIVAGHTRYKAAKKLGLKEVPCITVDELTDEQVKAFRLADNKTHELSGWAFDVLFDAMNETEFDMRQFGFGGMMDEDSDPGQEEEESGTKNRTTKQKIADNEEFDLDMFGDDAFSCTCPCCGFKFND